MEHVSAQVFQPCINFGEKLSSAFRDTKALSRTSFYIAVSHSILIPPWRLPPLARQVEAPEGEEAALGQASRFISSSVSKNENRREITTMSSRAVSLDATFRYETSWLFSPGLLFGLRAALSLYAFTTIFTIFGYNGANGLSKNSEHSFSFFTNLTYWGLAFYFLFSALHTGSYWLKGTPFLARWPRFLQTAHGMFYSTVVVYPWIVTSKCLPMRRKGSRDHDRS